MAKTELLAQIKSEAEGLDEMVRNLLAMTRIDAGALELRTGLGRSAGGRRARGQCGASDAGRLCRSQLDLPAELPMIRADAILVEQALSNVVNNASRIRRKERAS